VRGRERVSFLEVALILIIVVAATAFGLARLGEVFDALGGTTPASIAGSVGS
jgi:hypothetical protein